MKMVCRKCRADYDSSLGPQCPTCGAAGLLKTSTIRISAGQTDLVYRSLGEMPARLRTRLLRFTTGVNSGTILIADRHGRDEILRALRRVPESLPQSLVQTILGEHPDAPERTHTMRLLRAACAVVVAATALILIWLVFGRSWF